MNAIMAWVNGAMVPMSGSLHSMFDNVTSYAGSVFEGIRIYPQLDRHGQPTGRSAIWLLDQHIDRLLASAKSYRLGHPYSHRELVDATIEVARRNGDHSYVRPVIFRGEGLGVDPAEVPTTVAIGTVKWGKYVKKFLHHDTTASVYVSSLVRPPARFFQFGMSKGAPGYGAWSQPAKLEANEAEASEALLQGEDEHGERFIVDGSGMNICLVENGVVITPNPTRWNILYGKTLAFLLEELGYQRTIVWKFGDISLERLLNASEVFLTGTATEVTPVTLVKYRRPGGSLAEQEVADGHPGPVTKALGELLRRAASGQLERYQHLLSIIPAPAYAGAK